MYNISNMENYYEGWYIVLDEDIDDNLDKININQENKLVETSIKKKNKVCQKCLEEFNKLVSEDMMASIMLPKCVH
jgi:hypothetical protein